MGEEKECPAKPDSSNGSAIEIADSAGRGFGEPPISALR
jgi:hypothetical protein